MIKCGKLKDKDGNAVDQCVLFSKDGKKALGYFPYSKHGGEKGAKAAAAKRERVVQFFKQKHQELTDALDMWGMPNVLKYLQANALPIEKEQTSFEEIAEKALTFLQKDDTDDAGDLDAWLESVDLAKLEAYLDNQDDVTEAVAEPEPTEGAQPTLEPEPEPDPVPAQAEAAPEPEPEEPPTFETFIRSVHRTKAARMRDMMLAGVGDTEVTDGQDG